VPSSWEGEEGVTTTRADRRGAATTGSIHHALDARGGEGPCFPLLLLRRGGGRHTMEEEEAPSAAATKCSRRSGPSRHH
jgi:hypothetical protein